jgi:ATP-dependent DNA helicase RecG
MNNEQLGTLLQELSALPREIEWVEFKLNKGSVTNEQIGEYISALSNGACIKNQKFGYLVWGVEDKAHELVGTNLIFADEKEGSQDLELWLRMLLNPKINFNIFQFANKGKNFVLLRIPAAVAEPVYFKNKAFIRIGSHKTELTRYPDFVRQIYNSTIDWSAEIIDKATIKNLDPDAIALARKKYKERNNKMSEQIDTWSDELFLDKAKLTIDGKITRTTMLLLGKDESSHFLLPSIAQITWKLDTEEKAYEHFGLPIILTASEVADKIRNYPARRKTSYFSGRI